MGNKEVFVFGSNTEGRHGAGAARYALLHYGAVYGQPEGRQGDSYAIVTKDLKVGLRSVSLLSIAKQVAEFLNYASKNSDVTFKVSPIGCGLAGFTPLEIAPMFNTKLKNVILPIEFDEVLYNG